MDYFAMRQLRELRELDADYAYLKSTTVVETINQRYSKLHREIAQRRDSMRKELENHLDSK